jgi:hypothetical protein
MMELLFKSAFRNEEGLRFINPVEFVKFVREKG